MARSKSENTPLPKSSLKSSITVSSVVSAIENKALPWVESGRSGTIIVPRNGFEAMEPIAAVAEGFDITSRPLQSKRVPSRARPGGYQFVSARWPAEGLEAKVHPMIACTIKGPTDLQLNDYVLHCKEGHFILIPPGLAHPDGSKVHVEGEGAAERTCDILWFCSLGDVLKCWICRSENGKHQSLPGIFLDQKLLCTFCDALFENLEDRSAVRTKIRQGLLITLLSSAQNEIQEGRFTRWLPQAVSLSSEEEADPIKRAHIFIRQHMGEPLTVERVARYSFMSRSQFAKKFTEQTGETFTEFLTRCRLEEAKLRLTTTTAQIAGIGRYVGLKPRQFNHLFRLHTGSTPGDFRRDNGGMPPAN